MNPNTNTVAQTLPVCPVTSPEDSHPGVNPPRLRLPTQRPDVLRDVLEGWYAIHPSERERACRDHGTSPPTVLAGFTCLARHMNRATGDCFPTQETLRTLYGPCEKTWGRIARTLASLGLLEILVRDDAWAVYGDIRPDADLNRHAYRFSEWCSRRDIARRPSPSRPRPVRQCWERRVSRQVRRAQDRHRKAVAEGARREAERAVRRAAPPRPQPPIEEPPGRPRVSPARRTDPLPLGAIVAAAPTPEAERPAAALYAARCPDGPAWGELPPGTRQGWVARVERESEARVRQFAHSQSEKTPAEQGVSPTPPAARYAKAVTGIARILGSRASAGAIPREIPPKPPQ